MAVDDHRRAPVLLRPVVADGQAELVGLAGRLAVEGEVSDPARAAPLHLRLHPGVGDDELAVVEDVVADEAVEEAGELPRRTDGPDARSGKASISARLSASPCVIWTFLPWSFLSSFTSWLPGTQRAEP